MVSRNDGGWQGVLGLILLVGMVVWWCVDQALNWQAAQPFASIVGQATQLCQSTDFQVADERPLHINKIVLIDAEAGRVHSDFRHLDELVRAMRAEEAKMVACVKEDRVRVGKYTDGAAAFRIRYDVWLVDLKSAAVLGGDSLWGSPPPHTKRSGGSATGGRPTTELNRWLIGQ